MPQHTCTEGQGEAAKDEAERSTSGGRVWSSKQRTGRVNTGGDGTREKEKEEEEERLKCCTLITSIIPQQLAWRGAALLTVKTFRSRLMMTVVPR